jgi:hypothetical protein
LLIENKIHGAEKNEEEKVWKAEIYYFNREIQFCEVVKGQLSFLINQTLRFGAVEREDLSCLWFGWRGSFVLVWLLLVEFNWTAQAWIWWSLTQL